MIDPRTNPTHRELAEAYAESQRAVADLVRAADVTLTVPACPDWSIRDLLAHLSANASDAVAGTWFNARFVDPTWPLDRRMASVNAHTAEQISSRAELTLDELLHRWSSDVPALADRLAGDEPFADGSWPDIAWVIVSDLVAHVHDVRAALAAPGDRKTDGVRLGFIRYLGGFSQRIDGAKLGAVELRTDAGRYAAGSGETVVSVEVGLFEAFRGLCGRRSRAQLEAWRWSSDPSAYLPLVPAYGERLDDIAE